MAFLNIGGDIYGIARENTPLDESHWQHQRIRNYYSIFLLMRLVWPVQICVWSRRRITTSIGGQRIMSCKMGPAGIEPATYPLK